MKLPISELTIDPFIYARARIPEAAVDRYAEADFEEMPPVTAYRLPDGTLLLADGVLRVRGAERQGLTEIAVDVRTGSRGEAEEWAIIGNARNGEPFTKDERIKAIQKLIELGWPTTRIGKEMGITAAYAGRVRAAMNVRETLTADDSAPVPEGLWEIPDTTVQEIAKAPEEDWRPLATAAAERKWSQRETRQAVKDLQDPERTPEYKEQLRAGEADPLPLDEKGEPTMFPETLGRMVKEGMERDAYASLLKLQVVIGRTQTYDLDRFFDRIDREEINRLISDLRRDIAWLQSLLSEAERQTTRLEAVS